METHKLDTETQVFFYEQDFYVLSNFSSFKVTWRGIEFDTSEHAYHFAKFTDFIEGSNEGITHNAAFVAAEIRAAKSAHEAFKIAERNKIHRHEHWDNIKEDIMYEILLAKVTQHEYVHKKLLQTGNRELIEDSWRDDFWGWGPNRDGKNMLGKLWMKIRDRLVKNG